MQITDLTVERYADMRPVADLSAGTEILVVALPPDRVHLLAELRPVGRDTMTR